MNEISKQEKIRFMEKALRILNDNNVKYVIYYGTLLGIVRDDDIIPWDNDIDIMVFNIGEILLLKSKFEKENIYFIPTQNNSISLVDKSLVKKVDFRIWIEEFINEKDELFVTIDKNINKENGKSSSSLSFYVLGFIYTVLNGIPFKTNFFSYEQMGKITDFTKVIPYNVKSFISNIFMKLQLYVMHIQYINIPKFSIVEKNFYVSKVNIPDNAEKHLELFYTKTWKTPNKNWTTTKENRDEKQWIKKIRKNKEYLYHMEK